MKNDNDLVTTIMWGVTLGISLERVFHLLGDTAFEVIRDKFLKK